MTKFHVNRSKAADIILAAMFVLITVLYALLMFKDAVPLIGYIGITIFWLGFIFLSRRISFATPMDLPILGFSGLLPLSLYVSIEPGLTWPKIHGFILSTALFYVIANILRRRKRLLYAALAVIFLSFSMAILRIFYLKII